MRVAAFKAQKVVEAVYNAIVNPEVSEIQRPVLARYSRRHPQPQQ